MRRTVIVALSLLIACGPSKGAETPKKKPPTPNGGVATKTEPPKMLGWRLPDAIRPTSYDLQLEIDANQGTFLGRVEIAVEVDHTVDAIWLQAQDLEIQSSTLDNVD